MSLYFDIVYQSKSSGDVHENLLTAMYSQYGDAFIKYRFKQPDPCELKNCGENIFMFNLKQTTKELPSLTNAVKIKG